MRLLSLVTAFCMQVFLHPLLAQYNFTLVGQHEYNDTVIVKGLWGYTDDAGIEYALVTSSAGLSIVSLENPALPQELFFIYGTDWRDVKTYEHYAYVVSEYGGGVKIFDLSNLPASIDTLSFTGDIDHPIHRAHTVRIKDGFMYLFGPDYAAGTEGVYVADLHPDPLHPVFAGKKSGEYMHDGAIRNDTIWAAEIFAGKLGVYDATDKSAITQIGIQNILTGTTHSAVIPDTGRIVFLASENISGYVMSYDATDLGDIKFIDKIKHGDVTKTMPHNINLINGFLVTSHYSEGAVIYDVHKPDNLIEVAHYDTSPLGPENLYAGAYEAYPYFASGNVIVSDRESGLMVLQPTYQRACYLEGTVINEITLDPISNALVQIEGSDNNDNSNFEGIYKTGFWQEGLHNVFVSASGCTTKTYSGISLTAGETTILNAELDCSGSAIQSNSVDAFISYYNPENQMIEIHSAENYKNQDIQILFFNIEGKLIKTVNQNFEASCSFSVADLPPSSYVMQMICGQKNNSKLIEIY